MTRRWPLFFLSFVLLAVPLRPQDTEYAPQGEQIPGPHNATEATDHCCARTGQAPVSRSAWQAWLADLQHYRRERLIRAGYRSVYLRALAAGVAAGTFELEELADVKHDLPDEEVASRLLALPGIGPYGAAHMMMLLGRHSRLILDSWTRPTYARLTGRKATDSQIERRFRRYGAYRGLAFWLFLTRDWIAERP